VLGFEQIGVLPGDNILGNTLSDLAKVGEFQADLVNAATGGLIDKISALSTMGEGLAYGGSVTAGTTAGVAAEGERAQEAPENWGSKLEPVYERQTIPFPAIPPGTSQSSSVIRADGDAEVTVNSTGRSDVVVTIIQTRGGEQVRRTQRRPRSSSPAGTQRIGTPETVRVTPSKPVRVVLDDVGGPRKISVRVENWGRTPVHVEITAVFPTGEVAPTMVADAN